MEIVAWGSEQLDTVAEVLSRSLPDEAWPVRRVCEALVESPDLEWERAPRRHVRLALRTDEGKVVGVAGGIAVKRPGQGDPPTTPDVTTGHVLLLAIEPEWRGRGQGKKLLAALEGGLVAAQAERLVVSGAPPAYLWPAFPLDRTEALCLLLSAGYRPAGRAPICDMSVDLQVANLDTAREEVQLSANGVEITRAATSDSDALREHMGMWSPAWRVEAMRALSRTNPALHVAWHAGRICGFAAYDVFAPASFGPMGTHPDLRGRGVGGVLLRRCLRDLRSRGEKRADILWVGPYKFYARSVGATMGRVHCVMEKPV